MREIKFRAWLKEEKRMIVDTQEFVPLIVTNKGIVKLNPYIEEDNYYFVGKPEEDYILMQYTGLKDRNGREIYEGDIVELKAKNYIVKFYEGCFIGVDEYDEHYEHTIFLNEAFIRQIKVIGNIYEEGNNNG